MKMLKVFKSFSLHSSTRSRKNYGRTTRKSRDIQLKVKKSDFFKLFNPQNILMKTLENVAFWRKTFFKVALEKFSSAVWRCSRYLNASTNIALRSRKKITIIRNVDQKIFKKNQNLESKNKSILHTTVVWSVIWVPQDVMMDKVSYLRFKMTFFF